MKRFLRSELVLSLAAFLCPMKIRCFLSMIYTSVLSQQHSQGEEVKPTKKRLRQVKNQETRYKTTGLDSSLSTRPVVFLSPKKLRGFQLAEGCSDNRILSSILLELA
jgi:hypothetical protein